MSIFNYFFYRNYRLHVNKNIDKEESLYSCRWAMVGFFMMLFLPLIILISYLFRGYYKMPMMIVAVLIMFLIKNVVVKYYKTNGDEIIRTYRENKKNDKHLPYFLVCCIIFLLVIPFPFFVIYVVFKVILPSLDFQVVGCLYDCVDFIKWPF